MSNLTNISQLRNTQEMKYHDMDESNEIKRAIANKKRQEEENPPAIVERVHTMLKNGGLFKNCTNLEKKKVAEFLNSE